jgi:DNA mismatch endonuclease (patch repair protein)
MDRSEIMSRIRGKNTRPEMIVRKFIWSHGLRYRLHSKKLPGTPDLVFVSKKKVIFVNGCFWHGHSCKIDKLPKTNIDFWRNKIYRNQRRDAVTKRKLKILGWKYLILWECKLRKPETFDKILLFLKG